MVSDPVLLNAAIETSPIPTEQTDSFKKFLKNQLEISGAIHLVGFINGEFKHEGAKNSLAKIGQDYDASARDKKRQDMNDRMIAEFLAFLEKIYDLKIRIRKVNLAMDKTLDALNLAIAAALASGTDEGIGMANDFKKYKEDLKRQKRKAEDFEKRAENAETFEEAEDIENEFEETETAFQKILRALHGLPEFCERVGKQCAHIGTASVVFFKNLNSIFRSLRSSLSAYFVFGHSGTTASAGPSMGTASSTSSTAGGSSGSGAKKTFIYDYDDLAVDPSETPNARERRLRRIFDYFDAFPTKGLDDDDRKKRLNMMNLIDSEYGFSPPSPSHGHS